MSVGPPKRTTNIVIAVTKDPALARKVTEKLSFGSICREMVSADYSREYMHGRAPGRTYLVAHARDYLGKNVDHRTLAFAVVTAQKGVDGKKELFIEVVCARPGNGGKMLGAIEELAATSGCARVSLEPVDSAVGFYKRMGYRWGLGGSNSNSSSRSNNNEESSYTMSKIVRTPLPQNRARNLSGNAARFSILKSYAANSRSYSHDTHRASARKSPSAQMYAAGPSGKGKVGAGKGGKGKGKPTSRGKVAPKTKPHALMTAEERKRRRSALTTSSRSSNSNSNSMRS